MIAILSAVVMALSDGSAAISPSDQAIGAALTHCLTAPHSRIPDPSDPAQRPPGLIEGAQTNVSPIAGTDGRGFSYEGTNPGFGSCGIALYGRVGRATRDHIASLIAARYPAASDIGAWDVTSRSVKATERYYGISLVGVAMLTRRPQRFAPTLEVEFHSIPVR